MCGWRVAGSACNCRNSGHRQISSGGSAETGCSCYPVNIKTVEQARAVLLPS